MSAGIRSGVNWMRFALSPITVDSVSTRSVLPSPGSPISSACPPESIAARLSPTTSSCPMMRVAMAARASASLPPSASISATRAWASFLVSGMAWLRIVLIWYQVTDLFLRPQIAKGGLTKMRDTSS
jgi:hypothetical protein